MNVEKTVIDIGLKSLRTEVPRFLSKLDSSSDRNERLFLGPSAREIPLMKGLGLNLRKLLRSVPPVIDTPPSSGKLRREIRIQAVLVFGILSVAKKLEKSEHGYTSDAKVPRPAHESRVAQGLELKAVVTEDWARDECSDLICVGTRHIDIL